MLFDGISIIVTLGFVNQNNEGRPELGDEFDHLADICSAQAPVEVVVVDRAWPNRWSRVLRVLGAGPARIKYVPCKPSPFIDIGYRAVNAMRNTGAIVASGSLFAFVDDFFLVDGAGVDACWEAFAQNGRILCPVHRPHLWPSEKLGEQVFSGHNPGIYMCSRTQFEALSGFSEHFDGAHGEADTEWENRLDRLLDTTPGWGLRLRKHGLMWRRTHHVNGVPPQRRQYPWSDRFPELNLSFLAEEGQEWLFQLLKREPAVSLNDYGKKLGSESLRCNRAFYEHVCVPRLKAGEFNTTTELTDQEVERLRTNTCSHHCGVCQREDRECQIQSYFTMPADNRVVEQMARYQERHGQAEPCHDPWAGLR